MRFSSRCHHESTVCSCVYVTHTSADLTCELLVNQARDHPPPTPFSHSHLHSLSPASSNFGGSQSKVNYWPKCLALWPSLNAFFLLLFPPLPPLLQFASGANIIARCWSLLTRYELNMDKHILRLTGRLLWGGGFTDASGNHSLSHRSCLSRVLGELESCSWGV